MAIAAKAARKCKWLLPTMVSIIFSGIVFLVYKSIILKQYALTPRTSETISPLGSRDIFQDNDPFGVGKPDASSSRALAPAVTVVTSFLPPMPHDGNAGNKEDRADPYTRWMEWSKLFRNMSNPVVSYFGSVQYIFYFESVRGSRSSTGTNMTVIRLKELDTYKLFAESRFATEPDLEKIVYGHAKYELMLHAASYNPFKTSHMIWLDPAGYNAAAPNIHTYKVSIPENFDNARVAYRTNKEFVSRSVDDVFASKETYMSGNFLIGEIETLKTWCQTYLKAMKKYLEQGKLGSDETTIYAMISDSQEKYRDLVTTYKSSDVSFALWYEKMSGVDRAYTKVDLPVVVS